MVSIPHGFDDANVNLVTSTADADALSGMTITSGIAVEVQAAVEAAVRLETSVSHGRG